MEFPRHRSFLITASSRQGFPRSLSLFLLCALVCSTLVFHPARHAHAAHNAKPKPALMLAPTGRYQEPDKEKRVAGEDPQIGLQPAQPSVESDGPASETAPTDTPPPTSTATLTPTVPATETATLAPTATSTDTPLPTATDTTIPTSIPDTVTPTSTATETATHTPTITAAITAEVPIATATTTPTLTPAPTITPTVTIMATPTPAPLPSLFISEFLANPAAVGDSDGEFIELHNAGDSDINLSDWLLVDRDSDRHTISDHLVIQPGQYLVLGRSDDLTTNGGVSVDYVYGSSISLANTSDEIVLLTPASVEIDAIEWTDGTINAGASLERTAFDETGAWVTAQNAWPGSAGDLGSPMAPYAPPSTEPTAIPTVMPTVTATPMISATGTVTATLTPTPLPTATATPTPNTPAPALFISEYMANPDAVSDADGEFIEIFNADSATVNLSGWTLADLGSNRHVIGQDILIPPGGYVVLGVNGDAATNGGVTVDYVYNSYSLSNSDDEIILLSPSQVEVDRVIWGDGDITAGASQERTVFDATGRWVTAQVPWPGSIGDLGSPGFAYAPPGETPTPTTTPTITAMPTITTTVTVTATTTVTPILTHTPTPAATSAPTQTVPAPPIFISEFLANPNAVNDDAGEFIELFNGHAETVNLRDWILSDLGTNRHVVGEDVLVPPGGYVVLALNGDAPINGGVSVDYAYNAYSLSNTSDEIILLAPNQEEVDRVVWGDETGLNVTTGASLERTAFDATGTWATAHSPWPGSAGDLGSPGSSYVMPPPTPVYTPTPTVTPLSTLVPAAALFISEFMANPQVADDADGEFIELYNADNVAVNLMGWILADLGSERHTIDANLVIQPDQYVILGRNDNVAENGGVPVDYVFSGFSLGNSEDEIQLLTPDGQEVDRVVWGNGAGLDTTDGASLERTYFGQPAQWATASRPWRGSAGDLGSPLGPYVPPVATATPILPPPTPRPTSAATHTPSVPPWTGPVPPIFISEFLANPNAVTDAEGEFIELFNGHSQSVNLRGWILADLGSNRHAVSEDLPIPAGGYVVLAINGDRSTNGGVDVDYVYNGFSLSNSDDEILLLAPNEEEADRVLWGDGTDLDTSNGASLERTNFGNNAVWVTAHSLWPGSAGDLGSPRRAYSSPPPGLNTPTPATTNSPPVPPPWTGPVPPVYISEFLANPNAVTDAEGEFIELFNGHGQPVNLRGWILTDLGSNRHVIDDNVTIPAGGYAVLAVNGDRATNGGINADYVYNSFNLSNGEDEILLLAPNEVEADRVLWGDGTSLDTTKGTSLERTGFGNGAGWAMAHSPWLGSAGDLGSPGRAYTPAPPGLNTPTPATTSSPPAPPPWTGPVPPVYISEFLANPDAVNDAEGEFIELFNGHSQPVNLHGWILADLGSNRHVIGENLTIQPNGYAVIAVNGDHATNGGVNVDYVYSSFNLSNGDDEILLLAPNEEEADRVIWGDGTSLDTTKGASLERTSFGGSAGWATAFSPWPGSAGDLGTPGRAYTPGPTGLSTPTPAVTGGPPSPPPWSGPMPPVFISEFLANPDAINDADGEFIEIFNGHSQPVNLHGWILADLGSNRHVIGENLTIQPDGYAVLAVNDDRATNGGFDVDYVYGGFNLSNGDDEILLLAPNEEEADRVVWGDETSVDTTKGASLERTGFGGGAGWATAFSPWPGSAGDLGTPGLAYTPAPPGLNTPTPATTSSPPAPPPWTGPVPPVYISEFLANPDAVSDADGEFIELFNGHNQPVDLRGWILADLGSNRHVIGEELTIPPGGYAVIAVNGDRATNGGFAVDYVYSSYNLSNSDDEILLLVPNEEEADRALWGDGTGLDTTKGASLERTTFDASGTWVTASTSWSGSAGDLGSPGQAYDGTVPPPILVPTPTQDGVETPTPTPLPPSGPVPNLHINEVMANPHAVTDSDGEYIELYNADAKEVNLRGWRLADLGSDLHVIDVDLLIAPGSYALLSRNADSVQNGGISPHYVWTGMNLANDADEVILTAPDGQDVDRLVWGESGQPSVTRGASLERVESGSAVTWVTAQIAWPGSAGDLGSPGMANGAVLTPQPGGTATPVATAVLPPVTGERWPPVSFPSPLQIDEVGFRGSAEEFVTLRNVGDAAVVLDGWTLGDAEIPGDGEGMYGLPDGRVLGAGERFIIARSAAEFQALHGRPPDAEFEESKPDVLTLIRRTDLATGQMALSDSGDEVVLLTPGGELADSLSYKQGDGTALGLIGVLSPDGGFSLQRVPGAPYDVTVDQRHRYLYARPAPFDSIAEPAPAPMQNPVLEGGLTAVWGTLGAASNFSDGQTAPPGYLLAAGSSQGLHFVAIADAGSVEPEFDVPSIIQVPAWRWSGGEDEEAIVYTNSAGSPESLAELTALLQMVNAPAQWTGDAPVPHERFKAVPGAGVAAPGSLNKAIERWQTSGWPLLLAGNSNPALPGEIDPVPQFTGLAVTDRSLTGIIEALQARRGWLTNRPGLRLTMRADENGKGRWMGETLAGANQITLHINYSDLSGDEAGLAIWQNGQPLRYLGGPSSGGVWSITLPAIPGATLFAVATQADGDYAVTSPFQILDEGGGTVQISEVMPSPSRDYNGDGLADHDDEFIELFNPGTMPTLLEGWQLTNRRGDENERWRFTFGDGQFIGGGERLVLYRAQTYIRLYEDDDYVRLLNAEGDEVDSFGWHLAPHGGSYSLPPDESEWQSDTVPTPGEDYGGQHGTGTIVEEKADPTEGQAGGPPGSVAAAKRQGLERWVEFQAVVVAPPGFFNSAIYVADATADGESSSIGIQVYLRNGEYPPLVEGDLVIVRGLTQSFRGEMEVFLEKREQIWRIKDGTPLQPLPVNVREIDESLEGRLVTFDGVVTGYQGSSIFLGDPSDSNVEPIRVTVRSSLDWKRPYVNEGERFRVTGIVSQFAKAAPWNDGYRVMVRYPSDLVRIEE